MDHNSGADHSVDPELRLAALQLQLANRERQLTEARQQIAELEALLEQLPDIFERKFQQRLEPFIDQQQRLLADNSELRQQMRVLMPARDTPVTASPEASSDSSVSNGNSRSDTAQDAAGSRLSLPSLPERLGFRRAWPRGQPGPNAA